MRDDKNIDYRAELIRKGIHLCSLNIPVIYYFIDRNLALMILVPMTLAFLLVDLLRYYHEPTSRMFYRIFGWMLRSHETDHQTKRLNGATNVLISATLCVLIFPKMIVITSFAILIISDSSAALIGRRFGTKRFFKKSVQGSMAFFLSSLLVIGCTPKAYDGIGEYALAAFASFIGTIVEALPISIDDNLSIPVSISTIMWLLYAVMYPTANIYMK